MNTCERSVQGEKCEITLVFHPSSQRPYFEDVLQVHVPNQHDQLLIRVKVRAQMESGALRCGSSTVSSTF